MYIGLFAHLDQLDQTSIWSIHIVVIVKSNSINCKLLNKLDTQTDVLVKYCAQI